jgi:hypothetical protein
MSCFSSKSNFVHSSQLRFSRRISMKTRCSLTILILFQLFSVTSFAQGEAAVPFLLLNPSPSLSAMGSTGAALPTDDPFGFLWNPIRF